LQLLELDVDHLCWTAGVPPATAVHKQRSLLKQQRNQDRRRRPPPVEKRNMLGDLHRLMSELILVDNTER
jgi:hypothetical protein